MPSEVGSVLFSLKDAFLLLRRKDPLVLCGATSFFATFSLSPIIIIIVNLFQLAVSSDRLNQQLFKTIAATLGKETAREIESIVHNFLELETNWWLTFLGLLFFIFVATTLLGVIKFAIQKIWFLKPKNHLKLKYQSRERTMQFAFLIFTGVLFGISLFVDTMLSVSLDYLQSIWPESAIAMVRIFSALFGVVIVIAWFTVLFKLLPEANITWDMAFNGGLLTGILFSVGKLLLRKILVHAKIATIFGASASIALLLLFIFYSSFILYYGAAFTHEYGERIHERICAGKYADEYEEKIKKSA
jgi:membrane protein